MIDRTQLPQLKGTEKQISWATTIREKAVTAYGDRAWELIKSIRSAAVWIANRDDLAELLNLVDDYPQMLTEDEVQDLDLDLYTKAELHQMWIMDKILYRQQVEIPWNFLLGIEIE